MARGKRYVGFGEIFGDYYSAGIAAPAMRRGGATPALATCR
jgi:hypothetical protein